MGIRSRGSERARYVEGRARVGKWRRLGNECGSSDSEDGYVVYESP